MTDTPEEESYVRGTCPHCHARWRAASSVLGRQARCRQCGKVFPVEAVPPDDNAPSLPAALQAELGLRLERSKGPVEVLVIDHVEKPAENQ